MNRKALNKIYEKNLCLGLDHDGHHLSGDDAGVEAAALRALAEVYGIAGLKAVLGSYVVVVVELYGHLAGDDVVDHFKVCGSNVCAAAREEVRKTVNDGAAVDLCGVVKTGGENIKMSGSLILGGFVCVSYFVRHELSILSYKLPRRNRVGLIM